MNHPMIYLVECNFFGPYVCHTRSEMLTIPCLILFVVIRMVVKLFVDHKLELCYCIHGDILRIAGIEDILPIFRVFDRVCLFIFKRS